MIKEAIILAGGLGTRLKEAVPDLPKCMAPVAGKPFLFYVISYLRSQGIEKFIFSLGFKHQIIEAYLAEQFSTLRYEVVIEESPLGTGGAIRLACSKATNANVLITNGDTLFKIQVTDLEIIHLGNKADATLALKPMNNFDRYGVVEINNKNLITQFKEKQFCKHGNINGGSYLLNVSSFVRHSWPDVFSFEKDYLETNRFHLSGSVQNAYFIDIGIPGDYIKAQSEFATALPNLKTIDKSWTLLIDRDGVINHEKKDDYILHKEEFRFYDGVEQAFQLLSRKFGKIIIVTNQRGVGRGLMTEDDLQEIHQYMCAAIEKAGGRVDKIYYCTSTDNKHPNRKPNPGMAYLAKADFPEIDLTKTIMVGNKLSDMRFGKNAGAITVFTATTNPEIAFPHPDIDFRFNSLADFAKAL